jgi:hypothetical protein
MQTASRLDRMHKPKVHEMTDSLAPIPFLKSASDWLCDTCSLSIFYLATVESDSIAVIDACLLVRPVRVGNSLDFCVRVGSLLAGHETHSKLSKASLQRYLSAAARGELTAHGKTIRLLSTRPLGYYSEPSNQNTWYTELHLQITGDRLGPLPVDYASWIDTELRKAKQPFDGMHDLAGWLGLVDRRKGGGESTIRIRIFPPVDILLDASSLSGNLLTLRLDANAKFEVSQIQIAIREVPGKGIGARRQVANAIRWRRPKGGLISGLLGVRLTDANSVLAMLALGDQTIRRHWFVDPNKSPNVKYLATHFFDKDLRQLRQSLLSSTDSTKFEKGVSQLLYLFGFSNAIQVETEAPDILVSSPLGKLALVECTTRISDFQSKVGKLVDRRNALLASLNESGNVHQIYAFLVCGQPKSQVVSDQKFLAQHKVTLVCREDLEQAFTRLQMPPNPDEILDHVAIILAQTSVSVA